MRKIRFRIFDKVKNNIKYIDSLYLEEEMFKPCNGNEYDVFNYNSKYYSEIMQYTGLKDKNGVEIYEGDILSNGFNQVVEYGEYEVRGYEFTEKIVGFYLKDKDNRKCPLGTVYGRMTYEVIGNIYENKDLL